MPSPKRFIPSILGADTGNCGRSYLIVWVLKNEQLRSLAMRYGTNKAQAAIDTFEEQITSFVKVIHAMSMYNYNYSS